MMMKFLCLLLLLGALSLSTNAQVTFDCDPCIARDEFKLQAIVHGNENDVVWQQVRAAMMQSAKDMRVAFHMVFANNDMDNMVSAIESAAPNHHALIVTIPNDRIDTVVQTVKNAGTPVFGLESGQDYAEGLNAFIGMDDGLAGEEAAQQLPVNKALFVHDKNDATNLHRMDARKNGLERGLRSKDSTATVDVLALEGLTDAATMLEGQLEGCPYQGVVLGTISDSLMTQTLNALETKGCTDTEVGTFGTTKAIHQAVSGGKLAFALSQQAYLQGAMSVVHAALYVTTGKHLAPSSQARNGILLSGPQVFTKQNALTDTLQTCEADAFPVCPNDKALDGTTVSQCPCTDRPSLKIAGVLHAVTTDPFWDIVYTAASEAADDFGIELELDRMEPNDNDVLFSRMATQITKLCEEGVDGIFVTIPSDTVLASIERCQELEVPIVSINAGPVASEELELQHHVGMMEFNAGYLAGKEMLKEGSMTRGICLDHAPGNIVLMDRCGGFEKALSEDPNVEYFGNVTVPEDNQDLYVSNVEAFVNDKLGGDWTGLGVLLGGGPQHEPGSKVREAHPEISVMGAFDTSDALYKGLDDGKLLFGMDQGPYLQGYLPIPLLAWQAATGQATINHKIESGPDFVRESPSQPKQTCELSHFKTCEWQPAPTVVDLDVQKATDDDDDDKNKGAIVGLSIVAVVCLISIAFLAYRVNRLKHYLNRLEEEGRSPPNLSAGDYISSAYMPVEKIVSQRAGQAEPTSGDPSASEQA